MQNLQHSNKKYRHEVHSETLLHTRWHTLAGTAALVTGALKSTLAMLAVQGTGPALSELSRRAWEGWGFSRSSPLSSMALSRAQ